MYVTIMTILAHLAGWRGDHRENIATEALGYTLRRSAAARDAIRDLLGSIGVTIPETITYKNQPAGHDGAYPDLAGVDGSGIQRILIEAKFWATSTDHQPVTYLKRLPAEGGVLVVVAPAIRLTLL
jgi:hypothetical protein